MKAWMIQSAGAIAMAATAELTHAGLLRGVLFGVIAWGLYVRGKADS